MAKKTLLFFLLIGLMSLGSAVEYGWRTDPASGSIQDGFCYDGVDPDEDIDCAGQQNWCDSRDTNRACDEASDNWLCNNGEWACDSGERINPEETSECESLEIEAEGCYSAFTGEYQCFSDGNRFSSLKPGGCGCEENFECSSGLCQSGACITYVAPGIEFVPELGSLQIGVDEEQNLNILVRNEMERNDTINLTFSGRAISEGLATIAITESTGVQCDASGACTVEVDSQSTTTVSTTITGAACTTSDCSGNLNVEATSQESYLTTTESLPISIRAVRDGETVEAPGLNGWYLLLLLVLAGLYAGIRKY